MRSWFRRSVPDWDGPDRDEAVEGVSAEGEAGSVEAGALVRIGARVEERLLRGVTFRAFACPHIIAACFWLAEQLEGEPPERLGAWTVEELRREFDIPVEKTGKILILIDAMQACQACIAARRAADAPAGEA